MTLPKPKLVVPGDDPLMIADSQHLERLADSVELHVYRERPTSLAEQIERAVDAEFMINSRGSMTWSATDLAALPRLRMISTCSIGVDSVDLIAAAKQGIIVSNVPARTAPVVAEHALALILATARRLAFLTAELKSGRWNSMDNIYLRGKTLGVIGTGAIGGETLKLARAIGMNVQAWTFHPTAARAAELDVTYIEFDELLATSDVVSLHVKLTDESRHLIGRRELAAMKPGSLLINTARGPVVDTLALVAALDDGHLAGAGVDVFDQEPIAADHPLLQCPQVVLTPHSADQNPTGRELLNSGAVDNVLAFLNGTPQNVVS
jgi:phosphoglycerate dehydrogenase-like enzyme